MAAQSKNGKLFLFLLVAIIGGAAGYGFFTQNTASAPNAESAAAAPSAKELAAQKALLAPKPSDIILGDSNALTTIVEYSSMSCSHCASFHEKVLPTLKKEFIDTGKAKLVLRHFPLNEPAFKASSIVECAGTLGLERTKFMDVFFNLQAQWAFGESFIADLKKIALVGGIDSAAFDSCLADPAIEARLLTMRADAAKTLGVNSTPSFFVNGKKLDMPSIEGFREAINAARPASK